MPLQSVFIPNINGHNLAVADFVGGPLQLSIVPVPTAFGIDSNNKSSKIYVANLFPPSVFEVDNPNCNLTNNTYSGVSIDLSATTALTADISITHNERTMYVIGLTTNFIYQYTLPHRGTIRDAFYSGLSLFIGAQQTAPRGITVSKDGSIIYVTDASNFVFQYTLSDIDDVSTGVPSGQLNVVATSTNSFGVAINNNGTKLLVGNSADRVISRWDLVTPFQLSTGIQSTQAFNGAPYSPLTGFSGTFCFSKPDGEYLFFGGTLGTTMYQYLTHTLQDKCP